MAQPLLTDFTKTESGATADTVWGSVKGIAGKKSNDEEGSGT
jgi:hypothetical protein